MSDEIRELSAVDFERAIPRRLRDRLMRGELKGGDDVAALRRFIGLSQDLFARARGISVHILRNWEQGRRMPEGPALALLKDRCPTPESPPRESGADRLTVSNRGSGKVIGEAT